MNDGVLQRVATLQLRVDEQDRRLIASADGRALHLVAASQQQMQSVWRFELDPATLAVTGGVELKLLSLEREWLEDPAHKQLARWVTQLYASVRSGIREPGMLDGRKDDRELLR